MIHTSSCALHASKNITAVLGFTSVLISQLEIREHLCLPFPAKVRSITLLTPNWATAGHMTAPEPIIVIRGRKCADWLPLLQVLHPLGWEWSHLSWGSPRGNWELWGRRVENGCWRGRRTIRYTTPIRTLYKGHGADPCLQFVGTQ